jgi:hypothetical protein
VDAPPPPAVPIATGALPDLPGACVCGCDSPYIYYAVWNKAGGDLPRQARDEHTETLKSHDGGVFPACRNTSRRLRTAQWRSLVPMRV